MFVVGSTINATVCAIERDIVLLEHDGECLVVRRGNVTWSRFRDLAYVVSIGDVVRVKITRVERESGLVEGSMKALRPELNPYVPLAAQPPNRRLRGVIRSDAGGQSLWVEFDSGARGALDEQSAAKQLSHGQVVEVVITRVDPQADDNNLDLSIVEPWKASGT